MFCERQQLHELGKDDVGVSECPGCQKYPQGFLTQTIVECMESTLYEVLQTTHHSSSSILKNIEYIFNIPQYKIPVFISSTEILNDVLFRPW